MKKRNIYKMVFIALLVSQALVLYWVEGLISPPIGVPGAKLGLTNIFTLVALYTLDMASTTIVVVLRVVLSMLLSSNIQALLFSISGALLSLFMMYLTKKLLKEKVSRIGVSVVGASFHNLGQLLVAAFTLNNFRIITLLPLLIAIAIPTGIFVGIVSNFMIDHLKKLKFKENF